MGKVQSTVTHFIFSKQLVTNDYYDYDERNDDEDDNDNDDGRPISGDDDSYDVAGGGIDAGSNGSDGVVGDGGGGVNGRTLTMVLLLVLMTLPKTT